MKAGVTHIGIYTVNLERMKNFYEKYFDAVSGEKYEEDNGFSSYFLNLNGNVRVEIMSHTELEHREIRNKENGISHIAFSVGTRENVIELTNRLSQDGYTVTSPASETGDGYFESQILDPDGNALEITE